MAEHLAIRDSTVRKGLLGGLLKGVQVVAETAFYIGCGAILVAWETIAELIQSAPAKKAGPPGARRPALEKQPLLPKVKIPLLPIDNYSRLGAGQIFGLLPTLSPEQLSLLRDFEVDHRNRRIVLRAIDEILSRRG